VDAVGITYFNPKKYELESFPTSYWCYQLTQSDEWLAVLGCVSDWQLPDVVKTFIKANKKLFPRKTTDPGEILYNSTFGRLIQSLTFNLVGPSKEVSLSLSAIRKIQSLQELLDATTESAAFIKQRADKTANVYFQILAEIVKTIKRQKLVVYIYPENTTSFTGELSNELQYRYPKKVILIGRNREGQYRCSIRSKEHDLPAVLSRALVGISGYGGGHTNACGLCVDANDWDRFLVVLKEELKK
jgi:hypothetical protein